MSSVRLVNSSYEVVEFPTTQEAYQFVLTLDPPMAFRTDSPTPVCVPLDPESSPDQLQLRTYAILPLSEEETQALSVKMQKMVEEMKKGGGIPGMTDAHADLITALAKSAGAPFDSNSDTGNKDKDDNTKNATEAL
ncbi:hypothetical protein DFQ27_007184 [Actinomortierella ambigua]|uniref:Uncharacterized protein n=1 Tax=Actinomortierella ambigua TaxID=1343610 RepID=A0A9P6PVF2_9FUNG|nr:hypothetical protein DFQ27_007184 [Actinomortierella ambigua]